MTEEIFVYALPLVLRLWADLLTSHKRRVTSQVTVTEVHSQVHKFELTLQYKPSVVIRKTKKSGVTVHTSQNLKQTIIY